MTEQEMQEKFAFLDPITRSTLKSAITNANGETNEDIRGRILRALEDEPLDKYKPIDVVYELRIEEGLLIIRTRAGAYLNVGTLKQDFLRRKKIRGKWHLYGKPTSGGTGYKIYTFKKEQPKRKALTSPLIRLEIAWESMTDEQKRNTVRKLQKM